jgi:hypothetical protein
VTAAVTAATSFLGATAWKLSSMNERSTSIGGRSFGPKLAVIQPLRPRP